MMASDQAGKRPVTMTGHQLGPWGCSRSPHLAVEGKLITANQAQVKIASQRTPVCCVKLYLSHPFFPQRDGYEIKVIVSPVFAFGEIHASCIRGRQRQKKQHLKPLLMSFGHIVSEY